MKNLNKSERRALESVLHDLKRGHKMLMKETTVIAHKMSVTSMPENTWINKKDNTQAIDFNKHVGTELCYLTNGIERLELLLNPPKLNGDDNQH